MAASGITLTSGMRKNLFSLQNTNTLLERTQTRLASGQRVNSAVDDPVNYFTALSHRQRAEDLSSRKDEMAESIQTVMAANEGVEAITALIASAKSLAQSALSAATQEEIETLQAQYNEVLAQIDFLAADSGYKGVNLLEGSNVTHEVKFDENGDSSLTMTGFDASTASTGLNISEIDGVYTDAVAASVIIGAGDAAVTFTADDAGVDGNAISVVFADPGSNNAELSVSVADGVITVNLATGATGSITSTASQVAAAVNANAEASALVTAAAGGTGAGAVGAAASTDLANGADATMAGTIGWWDVTEDAVNKTAINTGISQLDAARTTLRSEAQKLSTNLSTITIRQDFTQGMINTLEDGAAELTNADMNEEGANMLMLQTRQSLGTTSLSLASQAAQSVLRLF